MVREGYDAEELRGESTKSDPSSNVRGQSIRHTRWLQRRAVSGIEHAIAAEFWKWCQGSRGRRRKGPIGEARNEH